MIQLRAPQRKTAVFENERNVSLGNFQSLFKMFAGFNLANF